MSILLILWLFVFSMEKASGQCTFNAPFASSTWLDNTHGTPVFTETQVTGWHVTVRNQDISSWDCYDNSSSSRLVIKSTNKILFSTIQIDVYACLELTKVTDYSYTYVIQQRQDPDAGYQRLAFSISGPLDLSSICNYTASIPSLEFHVLVKQGMGASAAIQFPNNLLRSVNYEYLESDGTTACNETDRLDMCTDTKQLSVNYSMCPQQIAYTAGGQAWCVAKTSLTGYDCAVVMNQDTTLTGTATQFACICSNGNKMSVVANNCTSNQSPTSFPTAADGVTVIGYRLDVKSVYVNCVPTDDSDSSNVGIIVGIVIVLLILIAVVVVCVILYKRGKCVIICGHVKGCMKKMPGWEPMKNKLCPCCRNKVAESEKPILTNGEMAHVETINETATGKRPTLMKDKTMLSAITRSSTMAVNKEKSDLEKSLITRQATATSIGLDMKSEKSYTTAKHPTMDDKLAKGQSAVGLKREKSLVHKVVVKAADESKDDETIKQSKKDKLLSLLPCLKPKDNTNEDQDKTEKEPEQGKEVDEKTSVSPKDKKPPGKKGGGKKAAKGEKKSKTETKNKERPKSAEDKDKKAVPSPREPGSKPGTPKGGRKKSKGELTRAPTKLDSNLRLTSTPVPGSEKGKKGVVSVPAALVKPKDKRTDWTFLSCCFGNRSPPQSDGEPQEEEVHEVKTPIKTLKKKAGPGKPEKKGKTAPKKAGGGKTPRKKGDKDAGGKKPDANGVDIVVEDLTEEVKVERAKTMPERQKTALSIKDAEKVKVDVYVPDDKTNLKLKDTVVVKEKNGEPQLIKAKTDIGMVRAKSARSITSTKSKTSVTNKDKPAAATKKDKPATKKAKGGAKGGGKDKKKKKK